ncbi:hypothetical protein CNY89_20925, partial [Amaricoccus sp. HAR-UPW-R2A-40]
ATRTRPSSWSPTRPSCRPRSENVRGGDTILLKAGTYADLNLTHSSNRNYKFTEEVTIKSADPTHQAVVNELFIRGATNVTISDLKFDYTGVQAPTRSPADRRSVLHRERGRHHA